MGGSGSWMHQTAVGISAGLSQFLAKSPGQWVVSISAGDILAPEALVELVRYLDQNPDKAMIYSDEDVLGQDGNCHSPYFKPHWSPDLLLNDNYIGRLVAYRNIFSFAWVVSRLQPAPWKNMKWRSNSLS